MFPLRERKITGYTFGVPTFYSKFHLGTDYGTEGLEVFAPFDGKIIFRGYGQEGGNTLWLKPNNLDVVIRFLHLDKFLISPGQLVKEGQNIAITGNTGESTQGHLHLDISKHAVDINNTANFIDPEKFAWEGQSMNDYVKTINLDGEIAGYVPLRNAQDIELFNKIFNKNLTQNPDGSIPTDIQATKK